MEFILSVIFLFGAIVIVSCSFCRLICTAEWENIKDDMYEVIQLVNSKH